MFIETALYLDLSARSEMLHFASRRKHMIARQGYKHFAALRRRSTLWLHLNLFLEVLRLLGALAVLAVAVFLFRLVLHFIRHQHAAIFQ